MKVLFALISTVILLNAGNLELGMKAVEHNDFKKAYEYFSVASQNGNRIAQQNMAVLLYNGYGVSEDKETAISLFKSPSQLIVLK
jgi:TPR repeat protein